MFVMNVHGEGNRSTYFTGAFPSACGKTSTSMLEGETIVGDDIAYLREKNGKMMTVNVEAGIFGIIQDINAVGDPAIYDVLTNPGEVIFSNVLVTDDQMPYWLGKTKEWPLKGINYQGEWVAGKKEAQGAEITPSHKNARYTISLSKLKNRDVNADNPEGVEVNGIIYGGRDSSISVPVEEAFDWAHGIIAKGASLESETTAATLGQEGVLSFSPMSNIDFLSISLGSYIQANLDFAKKLHSIPPIFSVNYFLKNEAGKYLNGVKDKHVWIKWMEQRVHGEVDAITTPTGRIPRYEDLQRLFKQVLNKDYSESDYVAQFSIRVQENLKKLDRIVSIYKKEGADIPAILFDVLTAQKERLQEFQSRYGDVVSPFALEKQVILQI
jgi:phosphoenolpyruvate carboxykinase (GTP)